jgi:dTDP-4-dehydrorhamnose 3,5-epimerase
VKRIDTTLPGVYLVEPKVFGDGRGFFYESWNAETFAALGIGATFVQDNHSRSAKGVLRGLHYQIRQPQGKLARVAVGRAFDVAVDIRRTSPTFGKWFGAELTAANKLMMWIPPGFAHGFLSLADGTEFLYKCTDFYAPQHDRSLLWSDPDIGIGWPLEDIGTPAVSAKDGAAPALKNAETFQ